MQDQPQYPPIKLKKLCPGDVVVLQDGNHFTIKPGYRPPSNQRNSLIALVRRGQQETEVSNG